MNLSVKLGVLGATGVVVAGLAHAGWLAVLWWAGADLLPLWVPISLQVAVTLLLGAAVGWQLWRSTQSMQQQIEDLSRSQPLAALEPAGNGVLQQRFDFLQGLTERLSDHRGPELSLMVLRVLPTRADRDLNPASLDEAADLLRSYPACVQGAFAGRLDESGFGLCLPAHGVAADSAATLLAAVQAAASRPQCCIGAVDHLAGVSLGEALALLSRADQQARAAGAGQVVVLSARALGQREAQAMSPA